MTYLKLNHLFFLLLFLTLTLLPPVLRAQEVCEDYFSSSPQENLPPIQRLSFSTNTGALIPITSSNSFDSSISESLLKKIYTFMSSESEEFSNSFSASEFDSPKWHSIFAQQRVIQALLGKDSWAILNNFNALNSDAQIQLATKVSITLFELMNNPDSNLSDGLAHHKVDLSSIKSFSQWWTKVANWDPQINILYILGHLHDLAQNFHNDRLHSRWFRRMMLQRRMKLIKLTEETRENVNRNFEAIEDVFVAAPTSERLSSKQAIWLLHSMNPKKFKSPDKYGKDFTPVRYSIDYYQSYKDRLKEPLTKTIDLPELQAQISAYENELLEVREELAFLRSGHHSNENITLESLKESLDFYTSFDFKKNRKFDTMEGSILKLKNMFERLQYSQIRNDERRLLLAFVIEKMGVISKYNSPMSYYEYKWWGSVANYRDAYHAILLFYDNVHLFNVSDETTIKFIETEINNIIDYVPGALPGDVVERSMTDKNGLARKREALENLESLRGLDWNTAIKPKLEAQSRKQMQKQLETKEHHITERLDQLYYQRNGNTRQSTSKQAAIDSSFPYSYDPIFIFLKNWTSASSYLDHLDNQVFTEPQLIESLPHSELSHQFLETYTQDLVDALAYLSGRLAVLKSQSSKDQLKLLEDAQSLSQVVQQSKIRLALDKFDRNTLIDFADQIRGLESQIQELVGQTRSRKTFLESRGAEFFPDQKDSPIRSHYDQTVQQLELLNQEANRLAEIARESSSTIVTFLGL